MIGQRKSDARFKTAPRKADRVLVIKLEGLASFVQALAAAKAIRETHVGARITLLTVDAFKEIAEKCPYFDTVETDGKPRDAQATASLIGRIRAAKYDMVYDLEASSRTNTYYQGLRPWPPHWSGTAQGCSNPVTEAELAPLHALDQLALQLRAAGIDAPTLLPDLSWVRTALRDPPRLQPDYFGIRGRFVLLTPRNADALPARRWPHEKYAELARRVADGGVTPVILGGSEERDTGAAIVKAEPRAKNLVARPDFFQVAALAERAAFAAGDDVDFLHVAAAAGAPCVVLLSSRGEPERIGPRGQGGVVALTAAVVADLPVDLVDRQLRNCGAYPLARSA